MIFIIGAAEGGTPLAAEVARQGGRTVTHAREPGKSKGGAAAGLPGGFSLGVEALVGGLDIPRTKRGALALIKVFEVLRSEGPLILVYYRPSKGPLGKAVADYDRLFADLKRRDFLVLHFNPDRDDPARFAEAVLKVEKGFEGLTVPFAFAFVEPTADGGFLFEVGRDLLAHFKSDEIINIDRQRMIVTVKASAARREGL